MAANQKKHSRIRLIIQACFAALSNGYITGFAKGKIFEGGTKFICVPGMNCYSCPGALGACPIDLSDVDTDVEIFSVNGEEWSPLENNDVRVSFLKDNRQADIFLIKVSLTPEKSLAEGKLNFVRIKVMPKEQGYRLPPWVELWSVNVDGAAKIFDGSKTLNLTRVLGSLKDSISSASRPALMNINFVVTP